MPTRPADDHVVVCGLHDEGLRIVEQLVSAGVQVVVVDDAPDPRLVRDLEALGVALIRADSRTPEGLAAAGASTASALVCVESDDLHSLATALLVRETHPGLRTVVQLGNAAVGRALQGTGVVVLDVAGLAAPSVAEACLGSRSQRLQLGGRAYTVVEQPVVAAGSLRSLFGDLAPLAVTDADGALTDAPGRDHRVQPGDRVVLVGTEEAVRAAGLVPGRRTEPLFVGARAPGSEAAAGHATGLLRYLVRTTDRRLKLALGTLLTLVLVSVTVLRLGYQEPTGRRMSVLDALYFTTETIGTVGYGDFYFRDQQPWLRFWAIGLMIVGATLATLLFALLTNLLISRTLAQTLGGRRVTGLTGHTIVVGAGSVGVAVAEQLRARGAQVVVVDADDGNRFLQQLRAGSVPVVTADATLPETLRSVRLEHAAAVAVLTSDDLTNLETGLAVRDVLGDRRDDVPVVLRMFDLRLQQTVAASFGFREVSSPATLAAPWFVGAALGLDVLSTFYAAGRPVLVARLTVRPGRGLEGLAMDELGVAIRVVSLERADGTSVPLPRRDTRLTGGDTAYLVGPYEQLLQLLRSDAAAPAGG